MPEALLATSTALTAPNQICCVSNTINPPAAILILRNAHELPCNLLQVLEPSTKLCDALIMTAAILLPVSSARASPAVTSAVFAALTPLLMIS